MWIMGCECRQTQWLCTGRVARGSIALFTMSDGLYDKMSRGYKTWYKIGNNLVYHGYCRQMSTK